VEEQLSLLGMKTRRQQPITDELIRKQRSKLAAFRLAVQVSGLDEKEIYLPLGVDKATWSKILSGLFNFPTNKEGQFYDLVGNEIPLTWAAYDRGYALVPLQDEKDRRIADLEQANAELKREIQTLVKYGVIQAAKGVR